MKSITYPLAISEELYKEIQETAKQTRLSYAEAIRQSLALGIPTLRERLGAERITNVSPLPEAEARALYALPEDDAESIKLFTKAQSSGVTE